jgi:type VI secretion system secreted protein VgrG
MTFKVPALGAELEFSEFRGSDAVSRPFQFEVMFTSQSSGITSSQMLGQKAVVTLGEGDQRFFHGVITEFRFVDMMGDIVRYAVILRPWLWFLSQRTDNRIFQNMTSVQILEKVFGGHTSDYSMKLKGSYPPRDYCVQYGESDLDFAHRLMEDEGIFYYFTYSQSGHQMVLVDGNDAFEPAEGLAEIHYQEGGFVADDEADVITDWQPRAMVRPGKFTQTDYNFEKPSLDLMTKTEEPRGHHFDKEHYVYPGVYGAVSDGDRIAAVRLKALQAPVVRISAQATAPALRSGHSFKLIDHPRSVENDEYVILGADYSFAYNQKRVGRGEIELDYAVILTVAPKAIPYKPEAVTPWPVMKGPQTAVVVGPAGAEIYTDKYSRVKVQFFWDRQGGKDENSTCYIRVSSVWAGAGWGFIQIPRIGQEVIVDFLDGNPDRPIITGRVYNAEQMPPYGLPGSATQSGWKSNSSPGGGGWNELRFEDKAGSEEVYFQAQKDHNELVKNNETRKIGNDFAENVGHDAKQDIGHDRAETVGHDKSVSVGNNRSVSIGVNDDETVGSNRSLTVGSNETISVGSNSTETIGANHTQSVGSNQSITVSASRTDTVAVNEARTVGAAQEQTVGAARTVTVGAAQTHSIGADDGWTVGASQSISVSADQSLSVGGGQTNSIAKDQATEVGGARMVKVAKDQAHDVTGAMAVKVGKAFLLEAADSITLKTGSAAITMKKDGTINIEGKDITLNGSGKINVKASSDVTIKGSKINQN